MDVGEFQPLSERDGDGEAEIEPYAKGFSALIAEGDKFWNFYLNCHIFYPICNSLNNV